MSGKRDRKGLGCKIVGSNQKHLCSIGLEEGFGIYPKSNGKPLASFTQSSSLMNSFLEKIALA
jgi:hypothetical protein